MFSRESIHLERRSCGHGLKIFTAYGLASCRYLTLYFIDLSAMPYSYLDIYIDGHACMRVDSYMYLHIHRTMESTTQDM